MNLSILTNFGCPYSCEFCISDSQNTNNNYEFKLKDARDIFNLLKTLKYTRVSLSGGGDPLYINNKDIELLYKFIIKKCNKFNIELSVHTNFQKPSYKLRNLVNKYVISIHKHDFSKKFHYWTDNGTNDGENLRFTYVIGYNKDDLQIITNILKELPTKSRLTLKQLDGTILYNLNITEINKLIENNKRVIILPSGDYNLYYNLKDNKTYEKFKDINWS